MAGIVAAMLLLIASPVVVGTVLSCFVIGASGSLLANTIQASLSERHRVRRAQAIAELNLTASACAVFASVAVGAAERTEIGWRGAVLVAVVAYGLVGLGFRRMEIGAAVPPGAGQRGSGRSLPGGFWAYALILFLGVSVDWCIAFWGADFLEKSLELSRADAAAAMSVFFGAILVGRLAGSRLAARLETGQVLRGTLLVTGSGFLLFWLAPVAPLAVAGLFLTGLGTANVYPFAFSAALDRAGDRVDIANARLVLCGGTAVLVLPFVLGLLADGVGISRAYGVVPPLLLTALGAALTADRLADFREAQEATQT